MKFEQIRNATSIITYNNVRFLIDPWLVPKNTVPPFNKMNAGFLSPDKEKNEILMPMVELPKSKEEILQGVDVNINTHIHPDHIDMSPDGTVGQPLNKKIPMIVRDTEDFPTFIKSGFKNIHSLKDEGIYINGVKLIRTPACHGTIRPCGPACGIIFQSKNEPTVYLTGDTIWNNDVAEVIKKYNPDIIIINACGAELIVYGRLIMNDSDVKMLMEYAPKAKIILTHMDTVSHLTVTRTQMRQFLEKEKLIEQVFIPEDGDIILI